MTVSVSGIEEALSIVRVKYYSACISNPSVSGGKIVTKLGWIVAIVSRKRHNKWKLHWCQEPLTRIH